MDIKDRHIIRELQRDGRLTNQDLAERVNLSPSPCLRRVKNLEKRGIIKGYTALIDQKAYGLPLTIFIRISLDKHTDEHVKSFENQISEIDEILDCYLVTGNDDYIMRVVIESLDAYELFVRNKLHKIKGLASIDTSFAYGKVKQSNFYPVVSQ